MNKSTIFALLIIILMLFAGCRKISDITIVPTESAEPLVPGVEDVKIELKPEDFIGPAEETEGTTASTEVTEAKENLDTESVALPAETESPDTNETEPSTTEPAATEPSTTEPPATEPPATEPPVTLPPVSVGTTSYEWYNSLSGAEQVNFFNTFESTEAFVNWYNSAKAEYDALHPDVEVGNGSVDLGKNGS